MRKTDELKSGCMARALDDEMTFVLLGRDAAAPDAIVAWTVERIERGLNNETDAQITEAIACASTMQRERDEIRLRLKSGESSALDPKEAVIERQAKEIEELKNLLSDSLAQELFDAAMKEEPNV